MSSNFIGNVFINSWKPYIWLFVISLAIYSQTWFYGFSPLDDTWILVERFDYISDPGNIKDFFTEPLLGAERGYYRPVRTLVFMFDSIIGGGDPFYYHFTNTLLHAITILIVFLLLIRMFADRERAFFFSVLFAIHPVFVFNVAWIPGRVDVLMALFSFLSFYYFILYHSRGGVKFLIPHLVFFILAMFTKESATVIPVLSLIYSFIIPLKNKRHYGVLIPAWIIILAGWVIIRSLFTQYPVTTSDILSWQAAGNFLESIIISFGKVFIPVHSAGNIPLWTGLLLIVVFSVLVLLNRKRNFRLVIFGILWFLAFISLPALFKKDEFNEWWIYPSIIGIFILINQSGLILLRRNYGFALLCLFIVFFSVLTVKHNLIFRNEISFADYYVKAHPDYPTAYYFRGAALAKAGRMEEAIDDFDRVIEKRPDFINAYYNRGVNYFRLKKFDEAIEDMSLVIDKNPRLMRTHFIRGMCYFHTGNFPLAQDDLRLSIRKIPENKLAYYYMALTLYELKQYRQGWDYLLEAEKKGYPVNSIIKNRFLDKMMADGTNNSS